jgi:hypothetical protein
MTSLIELVSLRKFKITLIYQRKFFYIQMVFVWNVRKCLEILNVYNLVVIIFFVNLLIDLHHTDLT